MTGHGLALRPLSDGVHFDVTGDGVADSTGWIGAGNALLVRDSNGNGRIDDAHELVSEQFGSGFNSSLEALASFDRNHDGRLDASDETFATLKVWQDANSDGVSQAAESRGLAEAGSRILGTASMTMADGSSHMVAGVAFDVAGRPPATGGSSSPDAPSPPERRSPATTRTSAPMSATRMPPAICPERRHDAGRVASPVTAQHRRTRRPDSRTAGGDVRPAQRLVRGIRR